MFRVYTQELMDHDNKNSTKQKNKYKNKYKKEKKQKSLKGYLNFL